MSASDASTRARVAALDDLDPGSVRLVEVAGVRVCLARTEDGDVHAVDDTCTHEDEPLSEGWVEDDCIECPAHNSVFDLRTGESRMPPAMEPVAVYAVDVVDGDVFVTVPDQS